jgi:hypothetical protein
LYRLAIFSSAALRVAAILTAGEPTIQPLQALFLSASWPAKAGHPRLCFRSGTFAGGTKVVDGRAKPDHDVNNISR